MIDKLNIENPAQGYLEGIEILPNLKSLTIKSHNVHCIAGEDKLHMSTDKGDDMYKTYNLPDDGYHSIISIDDVDYLYDDHCWNACRYQKGDKSMQWSLLTKDEISKDHTLSFNERRIDNNTIKVPRKEIQIAMQRVATYREDRRKKSQGKFSEQEVGESTINTPVNAKDASKQRMQNDRTKSQQINEK